MPPQSFLPPAVAALRAASQQAKPLFTRAHSQPLGAGLTLHLDAAARMTGQWASPANRLLELATDVQTPGAWFALHVTLDLPDLAPYRWIGIAARSTAGQATAVRVCLRSLLADGFHDQFFARDILSRSVQSDHHDLIDPAQFPDLPSHAQGRELVLFLPAATPVAWALHDLAVFGL